MASPQLEDGYTRIANELMEELIRRDFNGSQLKVILCLIRNTYGYGRKECGFSIGFICENTGLDRRNATAILKSLINGKVFNITSESTFTQARKIALNKNYEEWKTDFPVRKCTQIDDDGSEWWSNDQQVVNQPTGGENTNSWSNDQQRVVVNQPTGGGGQMTTHKRNILKKDKEIYMEHFEKLWQLYPKKRGKSAVSKKAMLELYEAGYDTVASAIETYKREMEGKDEQYILYGSTFFNGRWKEYVPEKRAEPSPEPEQEALDLWGDD